MASTRRPHPGYTPRETPRGGTPGIHVKRDTYSCLRLPDSKTGAKVIHLPSPAIDVLNQIERHESNPFVIVGQEPCSHLVNLRKPWHRIRKRAGLEDVRLHDLRHSFASVGASIGLSLPMIGKMLGHNHAATTQRYAHLAADPVKEAVDRVGERIAKMMDGSISD